MEGCLVEPEAVSQSSLHIESRKYSVPLPCTSTDQNTICALFEVCVFVYILRELLGQVSAQSSEQGAAVGVDCHSSQATEADKLI